MALSKASEDIEKRSRIIALLMEGAKPFEIVQEVGCSYATVTRVKQSLPNEVWQKINDEKFARIQDLITDQLEMNLDAMSKISGQFQDDEWRAKQDALHLATSYGIFADKSVRILEAMEAANIARQEIERRELSEGGPSN